MPRVAAKWLIAFYGPDGQYKDAVERTMFIRPATWAKKRCGEGETYDYWNITYPEDEQEARAKLEHRSGK